MLKTIRKADIILLAVLVIAGAALTFAFGRDRTAPAGGLALVMVGGSEYGAYPLSEDRRVEIKRGGGLNVIEIKNGKVKMTAADCRNRTCVREGAISKRGETIVCLPHKVMVEIKGEGGYDAVAGS